MKSAYEILKSDKELNYILDNANYNMNHTQNFERAVPIGCGASYQYINPIN